MRENIDNMIRTQISLEQEEYLMAQREARAQGISVAEFVRRSIRKNLSAHASGQAATPEAPWMRYLGLVETGDPNSSQTVDEIVYGRKD